MRSRRSILKGMAAVMTAVAAGSEARGEAEALIRSIGYDASSQTLTVVLAGGRTLRYLRVPERVYRDFQASKSKSAFYARNIQGRYEFTSR